MSHQSKNRARRGTAILVRKDWCYRSFHLVLQVLRRASGWRTKEEEV